MLTVDKVVKKTVDLVSDRHTRSMLFLVITAVIIFLINGLLPTIEGKAHYTADPVTVTYAEYLEMKEADDNCALTWGSESDIMEYKIKHNTDDIHLVEIPDTFIVSVYTKFFFQHPFWYITTLVRVVSAVVLFYSIFNYLLTRYKDTHKRYISLSEELVQLSNNSLDPSTKFYKEFEPMVENAFDNMEKKELEKTGETCPECGGDLVVRTGKYGKFVSCSNYPKCKYIKKEEKAPATEVCTCIKCGKPIVERTTKKGKVFYGCSNFPKCKEAYWDKPVGRNCPECNSMLVEKDNIVKCSGCDYKEV